jgi:hypothetical protein
MMPAEAYEWPRSMLSVNVNGLNGQAKRRKCFLQLMRGNWDVVVLLETHCPSQQVADDWLHAGRRWAWPALAGA